MTGNSGRPRILAFVIDSLLAAAVALLAVAAMKSADPYVGVGALSLTYLSYFFISEALWSRTPGKYLQGLAVVDAGGGPCGWRARQDAAPGSGGESTALRGLPAGMVILTSKRNQRLGDLAAGTLVVSSK